MDKGYYPNVVNVRKLKKRSQSTIKMDKGYYVTTPIATLSRTFVAIHNKNGQGLLLNAKNNQHGTYFRRNPQ